jgi:nitroreductase
MNPDASSPLDLLFGRRSIRVYSPGPVTDNQVETLLRAAMAAPSAVGCDPWRFIVLRRREVLERVAEGLPHGRMLGTAAVGFVICGDLPSAHDRQLSYMLQDCSAAIQNLLLAAHALGLGACWLGVHPRQDRIQHVSEVLHLPPSVIPVAAVSVGCPGEVKEPRTRYNPAYVHHDQW